MSLELENTLARVGSYCVVFIVLVIAAYILLIVVPIVTTDVIRRGRERRHKARLRAAFARRPRGRVARIGTVTRLPDGRDRLDGFEVDCLGKLPVCETVDNGDEWVTLLGGFTISELKEMARRRSEFEPLDPP